MSVFKLIQRKVLIFLPNVEFTCPFLCWNRKEIAAGRKSELLSGYLSNIEQMMHACIARVVQCFPPFSDRANVHEKYNMV